LVFSHAWPSSTIDPRQSTTVPKVSKTNAFTTGARADSWPLALQASAAAPMPALFTNCRRVISKAPATYYIERNSRIALPPFPITAVARDEGIANLRTAGVPVSPNVQRQKVHGQRLSDSSVPIRTLCATCHITKNTE
jgi:hypothetical protein